MFPTLAFSVTGLDPHCQYNVFVDMVLADPNHWKFQTGKWVPCGQAEQLHQSKRIIIYYVCFLHRYNAQFSTVLLFHVKKLIIDVRNVLNVGGWTNSVQDNP